MAPAPIEIEIAPQASCIVTLRAEHDASTGAYVAGAMELARIYRRVLVDLSECTFIDSSVLEIIVEASEQARTRGRTFELVVSPGPNPVRRIIEMAQLDALGTLHATRAAAVAEWPDDDLAVRRDTQSVRAHVEDTEVVEPPPAETCARGKKPGDTG